VVAQVAPGSPAEQAGLKAGDIILKAGGHVISGVPELPRRVGAVAVGGEVELVILRDKREQTVKVKVAEKPANYALGQQPQVPQTPQPGQTPQVPVPAPSPEQGENVFAGLRVAEIPQAHRGALPAGIAGVIVAEIAQDAPAAVSLKPGDVIEEINRQKIASVADFEKAMAAIPAGERAVLFITRGQQRSFVVLSPR
jgi:serine protease Do